MKYRLQWTLIIIFLITPKIILIDSWRWVITGEILYEKRIDEVLTSLWDKMKKQSEGGGK